MWKLTPVLFISCVVIGAKSPNTRIDPLVSTKLGLIRGLRSDDGTYSEFLGIPYAVVDEENPFAPSSPHPGFTEPFNANFTVMCPQAGRGGGVEGNIQCLILSIYVPTAATSTNRLPVMVHIHGGAFTGGGGTILGTPKHLLQKDVIFVNINYRLGIYGFMCTDSLKAPGNIGLKDQVAALRWIKENIASFGGDDNKITILGESAGGMSVHLHLLSPQEKVFHRAIMQSGTATSPFAIELINNDLPIQIAGKLGYTTDDLEEAIDFIAKTDVDLAVAAATQITSTSQYTDEPLTKACVERSFKDVEAFVPENPNLVKPEKVQTIPVMIGFASQELILKNGDKNAEFFANYSFEDLLGFGFDVTNFSDMSDLAQHFYIGDQPPSIDLANEITSFGSDFVFNHPTKRAVDLMVANNALAVYQYVFSYVGGLSTVNMMNTSITGASHCDDTMYLFELSYGPTNLSSDDNLMIDRMATLWTNFAKYGNPTPKTSDLLPVIWEPVSKESASYLDINKDLSIQHRVFHDRMAFWDLFYQVNESKTKWRKH